MYKVMSVIYLILVGFDGMFAYSLCLMVGFFINLTIAISRNEDVTIRFGFFCYFSLEVKIIKECEDLLVMIFKRCFVSNE